MDQKQRTEVYITLAKIPILILVMVRLFKIVESRKKKNTSVTVATQVMPVSQPQAKLVQASAPAAAIQLQKPEEEDAVWGRDPFSGKIYSAASKGVNLELKGILWDEKSPSALIEGEIVKEGDTIGQYTVIKINKDRVILSDGTKNFELKI